MPKNNVTDPITDREMAFAHLVLSGTMNDRRAAEAVGLNPATAAYTKSKPRVRAYMVEHRAAVAEKLAEGEAEGLRALKAGRDQILARLWELATLNPETTRGSMTGQIKALAMIVAIEGLIPSRRLSPPAAAPAPLPRVNIFTPEWLRERQQQAQDGQPTEPEAVVEAPPCTPETPQPTEESASKETNLPPPQPPQPVQSHSTPMNPYVHPERQSWVPAAADSSFESALAAEARRLPFSPRRGFSGKRR